MPYLLILAVLLSGCITTQTGNLPPPASMDEAAQLNLDLGIGYLRQGDLQQARLKLEKSIKEKPDNATAHRALGMVFERMGELDGAEDEYRKAVKLEPKNPDVLDQLAIYLCLYGDADEALKLFDRAAAIPLNPRRYVVYTNAGTCAKRENKLPLAEKYLREALSYQPNYQSALLQIADVAYQEGNYLQSRAFLERYLASGPTSPTALWLGYRVEKELEATAVADQFAQQILDDFPTSVEARLLLERQRND